VVSYENGMISLDSGKVGLVFDTNGEALSLVSLKSSDGQEWIEPVGGPLWKIAFAGPDGAAKEYGSDNAMLIGVATCDNGVQFAWEVGLGQVDVEVEMEVHVEKGDPVSYWSLRTKLIPGWKVTRADFPMIPNIKGREGLKLAVPAGWGLEYDVSPETAYDGTYPGCMAGMQFMEFYADGKGLYVGAHDPGAMHKVLSAHGTPGGIGCWFANWPGIPEGDVEEFLLPYKAAVGVFNGDYYAGAQIYREFTFTAPWSKAGPVSKRSIPQWLKDTDLWLKPGEVPVTNIEPAIEAKKFFEDTAISLHWYRWHEIPYDTLYPEYFPPKPGFEDSIKALQDAGYHVMPYINGRLCDQNSTTWNEEGGSGWAARDEKGEPYTEVYGSKVPLNVMCPYTKEWQDKISGLVERLVKQCGVDGVYIDQIGAAPPYRCYNPNHGHELGGGTMWVEGYRKLLDQARAKLGPDRILTTEENAECWLDQFDDYLIVNTQTSDKMRVIPVFPSVYSGRTLTYGVYYIVPDDVPLSIPFRAKMAQGFVWGTQLGWIDVYRIMAPEAIKDREFLKNLARCRKYGHQFVVTGRFLGMVDAKGDNPRITCTATGSFSGNYTIDLPAVLASSWEAEDGSIGILLSNMADEEHEVEVKVPLKAGKSYNMEQVGPDGRTSELVTSSETQKVTMPARGAMILSFK